MGRRYLRTFECEDCGQLVTRMWQAPRPLVCVPCASVRQEVVTTAAHEALLAHKRACRLELFALKAARPSAHPVLGVLLGPRDHGTVHPGAGGPTTSR